MADVALVRVGLHHRLGGVEVDELRRAGPVVRRQHGSDPFLGAGSSDDRLVDAVGGAIGQLMQQQHLHERVVLELDVAGDPLPGDPDELRERPGLVGEVAPVDALGDLEDDFLLAALTQVVEGVPLCLADDGVHLGSARHVLGRERQRAVGREVGGELLGGHVEAVAPHAREAERQVLALHERAHARQRWTGLRLDA